MIPKAHPKTKALVDDRAALARTAAWSPAEYALGDDRLEKWLIDQVLLSLMPVGEQLRVLYEMSSVLLALRDASMGGGTIRVAVAAAVPPEANGEWRVVEIGARTQIWRCGKHNWVIQLRTDADGTWRWKAGHSFRPFAACHTPTPKSKKGSHCLKFASVLVPCCLKHSGKSFLKNLRDEKLMTTVTSEAAGAAVSE